MKEWTSSEVKILTEMFLNCDTLTQMQERLGRTEFSIRGRLARLEIELNANKAIQSRFDKFDKVFATAKAMAKDLWEHLPDISANDIAKKINVPRSEVQRWARSENWRWQNPNPDIIS